MSDGHLCWCHRSILCVCEKLHVCKVGAVEMGSAEHFGHVGDHGFIVNVE